MDFRAPLSTPASKVVYRCYATHGKGFGKNPPWGAAIRILVINGKREVHWHEGRFGKRDAQYECDTLRDQTEWKRLGWVMADGSLPHGELDAVDPELTQLDYLARPDERNLPHRW
jgi:hypothetical protein